MCAYQILDIFQKYNKTYNLKFKTIFPPSFDGTFINKKKFYENSKIRFVTVCRLTKEKGLTKLIKIFSKYKKILFRYYRRWTRIT